MKLKYERFEGLGCFYVRGNIDASQFKLLTLGLETIGKDLEETLLVNLSNAQLDAGSTAVLIQIKKQMSTTSKQKIYWLHADRNFGDFPNVDLFISRLSGAKFRQIGERIKLDDALYSMGEEQKRLEHREKEIGGDSQNSNKVILENKIMKEQVRILQECIRFQENRSSLQHAVTSNDADLPQKLLDAQIELRKALATEVDL